MRLSGPASAPLTVLRLVADAAAAIFLNCSMPFSSVRPKLSSSEGPAARALHVTGWRYAADDVASTPVQ